MGQIMMRVATINSVPQTRSARGMADFVMRLEVGRYGLLEFGALDDIVAAGYASARETIVTWQESERFCALLR